MSQGLQGPPPLWLVALVLVGVVLAVVTIGNPDRATSVVLGVIVGAFVTFVFTDWRHARQRVNAIIGYARLLDAEIEANEPVKESRPLATAKGRPVDDLRSTLSNLTQEARRLLSKYANPPQRVRHLGFWVQIPVASSEARIAPVLCRAAPYVQMGASSSVHKILYTRRI
jgi:hypothetical protein